MVTSRLSFAADTGGLSLPVAGRIALWGAPGDMPLDGIDPHRVHVVQSFAPDHSAWTRRGIAVSPEADGPYSASIVTLPRSRDLAEMWLSAAEAATPGGLIVIDGAKTDGIDSLLKALKARVALLGQVSKAHGKIAWFSASDALSDWTRPAMARNADGDMTAPGVFSADAADPASQALAAALPKLKGQVVDLGAGWGWLSREILRQDSVKTLHLVEAERRALDCARINVTDARARFHWVDARDWAAPSAVDAVVMNPPFHIGRKPDPALGHAFIDAAARLLSPQGSLTLVANRHLPYEARLATVFRDHAEIGGNNRFKILHATRPLRARR